MRTCAIFDLDGTIINGSSERIFVRYLLEKGEISFRDVFRWCATTLKALPFKGSMAYISNRDYLKRKKYQEVKDLAAKCFEERMAALVSKKVFERIEFHKKREDVVIVLSGTLNIIAENFKNYLGVDLAISSNLEEKEGIITGKIIGLHPYSKRKTTLIQNLALDKGFDLKNSYSYANHHTDADMLKVVGNPIAVNPNRKLTFIANRNKWQIERF